MKLRLNAIRKNSILLCIAAFIIVVLVVPALQKKDLIFSFARKQDPVIQEEMRESREQRVEFGKDGYFPQELTMQKGDQVTFVNKSGGFFWPASNTHPIHSIYPEFDPQKPIAAGDAWGFAFERVGAWRYHDHLAPAFGGVIIVTDGHKKSIRPNCMDLKKLSSKEKEQCYDELITAALQKGGVKEAFSVIKNLYTSEPGFVASGCHQQTHKIGDRIYKQYAALIQKRAFQKLDLPPETVYCGYGFYHGILEHSFRDHPDVALGLDLCEYLDRTLSSSVPRIRLNCYHGLGHAAVREPLDKKLWGNLDLLLHPALNVCDTISQNPQEVQECLQGAFNVISDWVWRKEFGFSPDREDPFKPCEDQKGLLHKRACYYEMGMHTWAITGEDLSKIAGLAERIPDNHSAMTVVHVSAAGLMERAAVKSDHTEYVFECRKLPERFRVDCIGAIVAGLIAHGEPEQEYVKAFKFCNAAPMKEDEREMCFRTSLHALRGSYTNAKIEKLCSAIPSQFQRYCTDPLPSYAE